VRFIPRYLKIPRTAYTGEARSPAPGNTCIWRGCRPPRIGRLADLRPPHRDPRYSVPKQCQRPGATDRILVFPYSTDLVMRVVVIQTALLFVVLVESELVSFSFY